MLLGDGEVQEGMVWEAAMAASHYRLDNLTAILDHNKLQIDGPTSQVMSPEPLAAKWRAFGWHVLEISGHDLGQVLDALEEAKKTKGKPTMIIANTVKGKGVSFMENQVDWHGVLPSPNRWPGLWRNWSKLKEVRIQKMKKIATREAYGQALVRLGERKENIVVLDADLSKSTKTAAFAQRFPERFFEMGIAEQNMMGTAAGLSLSGKIPFASTFAIFATGRAFEQIRNSIAYPKLNVKIAATHAGLTVGEDGASHQATEDLALMRALPNMTVLVPADGVETEKAVFAAAAHRGPVYLRLGRPSVPVLYDHTYDFRIGKADLLRSGEDNPVAAGYMVWIALRRPMNWPRKASAAVLNASTIKPLDEEAGSNWPGRRDCW